VTLLLWARFVLLAALVAIVVLFALAELPHRD
jgi:hypothetical protein